jgi:hypothetical protein
MIKTKIPLFERIGGSFLLSKRKESKKYGCFLFLISAYSKILFVEQKQMNITIFVINITQIKNFMPNYLVI